MGRELQWVLHCLSVSPVFGGGRISVEIIYKCIMSLLASVCFGVIFQVRGIKLLFAGLGDCSVGFFIR